MIGLEEMTFGITIGARKTSFLKCTDDATLLAESKEGLKYLSSKVKINSVKYGLPLILRHQRLRQPAFLSDF